MLALSFILENSYKSSVGVTSAGLELEFSLSPYYLDYLTSLIFCCFRLFSFSNIFCLTEGTSLISLICLVNCGDSISLSSAEVTTGE